MLSIKSFTHWRWSYWNRFLRRTSRLSSAQWRHHVMLLPPSHVCCRLLKFDCSCPEGQSQSGGARVTISACNITKLVVLELHSTLGCLTCFGRPYIVLPLPDPVAPLRSRSYSAATTPPFWRFPRVASPWRDYLLGSRRQHKISR